MYITEIVDHVYANINLLLEYSVKLKNPINGIFCLSDNSSRKGINYNKHFCR